MADLLLCFDLVLLDRMSAGEPVKYQVYGKYCNIVRNCCFQSHGYRCECILFTLGGFLCVFIVFKLLRGLALDERKRNTQGWSTLMYGRGVGNLSGIYLRDHLSVHDSADTGFTEKYGF